MPSLPEVTRISLKNILFPTDFSAASVAALPFALSLARVYDSALLLAHAIAPEAHLPVVLDHVPEQDDQIWHEFRQKLNELSKDPSSAGVRCKTLLDRGDLTDVVPAMIHDEHVDMVVLGTHGRTGVSKMVLGSEAEKIYRTATCPVLTVGPKAHAMSKAWKLRRILCPVEVSDDPAPVLHWALSLAEENEATVIVMEAIPLVPWQHRPEIEKRSRRALELLIPPDVNDWCTPEVLIRWEHPAEAILHAATDREVDLIVMSVHKSRATALSAHLPWPVASEVVSRAHCPVLTVRV